MGDIEAELAEYMRWRMGGSTPAAEACLARAAAQYRKACRTMQRFGATSKRFWQDMGELSVQFDQMLNTFPGNAEYYFSVRQYEELVYPALMAISPTMPIHQLAPSVSVVGDLILHCNNQALPVEQQRAAARQLCLLMTGNQSEYAHKIRHCVITALSKLLFIGTERGCGEGDYTRVYDRQAAVECAKAGALKEALRYIDGGACSSMADWLSTPRPWPGSEGIDPIYEHEYDFIDAPIVYAALCMCQALIASGEAAQVAKMARWAAGKAGLRSKLLSKLHAPHGTLHNLEDAELRVVTARLAVLLGDACPQLMNSLRQAGLQGRLQDLRRGLDRLGEARFAAEVDDWLQRLFAPQPTRSGEQGSTSAQPQAQPAQHAQQQLSREHLAALPIRELKARAAAAGLDTSACTEKSDLVDLLVAAGGQAATRGSGAVAAPTDRQAGGTSASPAGAENAEASAAAQPKPAKQCAHCGKQRGPDVQLKLCARCKGPRYCSAECQRLAWPTHRAGCKAA